LCPLPLVLSLGTTEKNREAEGMEGLPLCVGVCHLVQPCHDKDPRARKPWQPGKAFKPPLLHSELPGSADFLRRVPTHRETLLFAEQTQRVATCRADLRAVSSSFGAESSKSNPWPVGHGRIWHRRGK